MQNLPLKHSPGLPAKLRPIEEAIAEINRSRATWRMPLLDAADFVRRAGEPIVGTLATAALMISATVWLVSP